MHNTAAAEGWSKLKAVAHTLPYDGAIVAHYQRGRSLPARHWAAVTVPTLVMDGGKSPQWMRRGNRALSLALPNALYRSLEGQTHMLKPKAHAPTLIASLRVENHADRAGLRGLVRVLDRRAPEEVARAVLGDARTLL
jgi:hypothetical protein